ncbi:MAG: AfsR/SARP family transcriptional regulator [Hamadaea sp.]|uniref:BTAD domain-containing putative transcriptional regulator n=1 Tax=Hamadaea sp. TaxID=2024425 RepID=UPI0017917081|nr:BTAD domain-containing putative transcriptional regulator [Hamadaea sp.]NUT21789.1 AfsR/SARP family transcriptional regulator [Hamadaea sp.]
MSTVEIRVLGSLSVRLDGVEVALGGPKQRAVLASLLLARPRSVSTGRILEDVWDGEAAPSMTTLHAYIAELRRVLEPDRRVRTAARVLTTEGNGYALRVDAAAVDSAEFARLAADGARLLRDGDHRAALAAFDEAIALWRGPAYGDLAGFGFLDAEIRRLNQAHDTVTLDRFEAMIELGRHNEVLGDLHTYAAEQPLAERGWRLYALALYRAGRQTDALDVLRTAEDLLADSFGLDASPVLRDLRTAILRHDARLAPASVVRPETIPNLPHAVSSFVGRDAELAAVGRALADARLVTVTGPAGIGKTRLAIEAAHRIQGPDGPWFVELADLQQPDLVPTQIAQTLGVPVDALTHLLTTRQTLLVLDNCEHLVDAVRDWCAQILTRCPGVRIVATSREALGIIGEVIVDVPPMTTDARRLFLDRAADILPGWTPDAGESALVDRICAQLDGLPLAIELAAAQCRVLSLSQIAAGLPGPSPTEPDRVPRHRDLGRAIAWSYDLLPPAEQALFQRLSTFAGRFDLDAAAQVTNTPDALPSIAALVRKSLLRVEYGSGPRRYRMLTALRAFAAARLSTSDTADLAARHRLWVTGWVEAAESGLRSFEAYAEIRRLEADQAEARAALTSALLDGDGATALRIAAALHWFWYRRGHITEGLTWLQSALDLAQDAPDSLRARALLAVAGLSYLRGDPATALTAAQQAHEAAVRAADTLTMAYALMHLGHFRSLLGDLDNAYANAVIAERRARALRVPWLHTETLMVLGGVRRLRGDTARARADLAAAIRIGERCGHRWATGSAAWTAMKSAIDAGEPEAALAMAAQIVGPLEADLDLTAWLVLAHTTAAAFAHSGRPEPGALLLGAIQTLGRQVGFSPELMNPIDGPREAAAVRDALPPDVLAELVAQGAQLSRTQAGELIAAAGARV